MRPSSSHWTPRKVLAHSVCLDRLADPHGMDVYVDLLSQPGDDSFEKTTSYGEEERDGMDTHPNDPAVRDDDANAVDARSEISDDSMTDFPEGIFVDGLGPNDFTEEHIEMYKQSKLHGCGKVLVIGLGDAVFPSQASRSDGFGYGYAISGDIFKALDRHAATLPPQEPSEERPTPPPQRFLYGRYIPESSDPRNPPEIRPLKTRAMKSAATRENIGFNVFRQRVNREFGYVYEYLGYFKFSVDRDPNGESLEKEQVRALPADECPDVIMIPDGWSPERAHRLFRQVNGGRQRMLYYLPRAPLFEYQNNGFQDRFRDRMVQIKWECSQLLKQEILENQEDQEEQEILETFQEMTGFHAEEDYPHEIVLS